MASVYKPPQGKGTFTSGVVIGIGVSALLFLAIPLTQILNNPVPPKNEIETIEMAPPPPPPPPEEPPPPPEPEEQEPPPELNTPPPPISLEQLEMALTPGTGGSLSGDFALPTFDVNSDELGGLEIFDLADVDTPPKPRSSINFAYPREAERKGIKGTVTFSYIVTREGRVDKLEITSSPSPILSKVITKEISKTRFEPSTIQGRPVAVKMTGRVPFN